MGDVNVQTIAISTAKIIMNVALNLVLFDVESGRFLCVKAYHVNRYIAICFDVKLLKNVSALVVRMFRAGQLKRFDCNLLRERRCPKTPTVPRKCAPRFRLMVEFDAIGISFWCQSEKQRSSSREFSFGCNLAITFAAFNVRAGKLLL